MDRKGIARKGLESLAKRYGRLRIAVLGDFCLDRYLDIDPERRETSLETGRAVHNVVGVRTQAGGAGTIVNNLAALGAGEIRVLGFTGEDGEGWELRRALEALDGVDASGLIASAGRRTFTYTKPMLRQAAGPAVELERLDIKNWSPTPAELLDRIAAALEAIGDGLDALILLEQVDVPLTGVLGPAVLEAAGALAARRPGLVALADSRRGLDGFPPVTFKVNAREGRRLLGLDDAAPAAAIATRAASWARARGQRLIVTLAEDGILGVGGDGVAHRAAALPVRGPIDIVGAGDAVTANLAAALAAGAALGDALEIAMAAASVVIHKLGTTGTASRDEIAAVLGDGAARTPPPSR